MSLEMSSLIKKDMRAVFEDLNLREVSPSDDDDCRKRQSNIYIMFEMLVLNKCRLALYR